MSKIFFSVILLWAACTGAIAQKKARVSGFVKDHTSGELLIGANVFDTISKNGYITDYNGYFSLTVHTPAVIQFSYVGYLSQTIPLDNSTDSLINIELVPGAELGEVIIEVRQKSKTNIASLNTKELETIPSIGGKPDVGKGLQLMPGINSQNEGSSLLLVRGGDPGQNLYIFDNVPVIHVNHLGGFMSVFNPDIINHIDVYKGGFPPRYGGKLSSIVDITQREGDISGRKGSLGIGVTDISFHAEGPLKLKNASFILAGRKTLTDPLLALTSLALEDNEFVVSYGFHDINGKFTWKPDLKNSFSFNIFQGDDYLNYWSDPKLKDKQGTHRFVYIWGNLLISAHWKSVLSSKTFISNSISYTRYRLKESLGYTFPPAMDTSGFQRKYLSSVQNFALRSELKYNVSGNYSIEMGLQSLFWSHLPNYSMTGRAGARPGKSTIFSNESSLYTDNKITFANNSQLVAGLRLVSFNNHGFSNISFEPRLNLNLAVARGHMLNLSYMTVKQFAHLLMAPGSFMANEVWVPAGRKVPPAYATQTTIGWSGNFANNMVTSEITAFYKQMNNLATYTEGYTNLKGDVNWQTKIETGGYGMAKGIELLVKKNKGKWTGFAGYTISNSTRQYPKINGGKKYLFDYDRLHSFSISTNYKINQKLNLGLSWVYQTGLPFTPAIGRQFVHSPERGYEGNLFCYEALIYGERNSDRIKDHHRLDVGLNYETTTKRGRKALWNFSVYNAHNRQNPYYYYYNTSNSGEIIMPELENEAKPLQLYQISFFPIIPSVSYKVFFDKNSGRKRIKFKQRLRNWLYYEN